MTNPTPLTRDELRAAAYFAVGVTSEGSIGGRDVSYRLSFAGNVSRDGRMDPVGNSGYSFGTLQIDLGQHPNVAGDLLDRYERWTATQPDRAALRLDADERARLLTSLQRTGRQMEHAQARDIDRGPINRFLASPAGRGFVHGRDSQHVNSVTAVDGVTGNRDSALERLQRTSLYRDASDADQARLAGMFMKLENQSGRAFAPVLLTRIERRELESADEVKTAVNGLLRNAPNGNPDYIQSGADNTLRGIALFSALRSASPGNPLGAAWANVVADPLVGPVAAHASNRPGLGPQYDAVRSLFLTPEAGQRMVGALEQGTTLAEGDPAVRNGRRQAGFFVSGGDLVHWNANGQGVACIDGRWRNIDPYHLQRVENRDGSVDLRLTENGRATTLLHVDPRVRAVDPRQATHPDHTLYRQTEQAVHTLDASLGRTPDDASERMAASLLRLARDNGFHRIDHVVLGRQTEHAAAGQNVFIVQGGLDDAGARVAHMPTEQAVRMPVEQSFRALEAPERERTVALGQQPELDQARSAPVLQRV